MLKRGIVITPPVAEGTAGPGGNRVVRISPQGSDYWDRELRKLLTYWDRTCVVVHPIAALQGGGGMIVDAFRAGFKQSELEALNPGTVLFAQSPGSPRVLSDEAPRQLLEGQLMAASELESRVGGLWSIGHTVDLIVPDSRASERVSVLEVNLIGSLPVPSVATPIERVLEFKRRKRDLYEEFISAIEHGFLDAYNSENQASRLGRAEERFRITLRHLWREMEAFGAQPRPVSLKGIVSGIVGAVTGMASTSALVPEEPLLQFAVGATGAFVAINRSEEYRPPELSEKVRDYAYVGLVQKYLADTGAT